MRAAVAVDGKAVVVDRPVPVPGPNEVLLKVAYSAINRADTLQRKGAYAPPAGSTDILGLEAVGVIVATGSSLPSASLPHVTHGAPVLALLSGGGNAEYATVDATHCLPLPRGMSLATAAAIPETWLTAYQLLHSVAGVTRGSGETVLIHAAGSGVGTAAVQLARAAGLRVIAVAGSDDKLRVVKELGAHVTVNYKSDAAWARTVVSHTQDGRGVDVILDPIGASFWKNNSDAIAMDGKWVLYGSMGGVAPEGPFLGHILRKRVTLIGTTLRNRSPDYKAQLVRSFAEHALSGFEGDSPMFRPIIDRVMTLEQVQEAHDYMESNANTGKILLAVAPEAV